MKYCPTCNYTSDLETTCPTCGTTLHDSLMAGDENRWSAETKPISEGQKALMRVLKFVEKPAFIGVVAGIIILTLFAYKFFPIFARTAPLPEQFQPSERVAVLYFWSKDSSTWMLTVADIKILSQEYAGRIKIIPVEVETRPELAEAYGVRIVPCTVLFIDRKEVDRKSYRHPMDTYREWFNQYLQEES